MRETTTPGTLGCCCHHQIGYFVEDFFTEEKSCSAMSANMPSSSRWIRSRGAELEGGGTRAHGEPPALKVCQVRDFGLFRLFSVESECRRGRRLCTVPLPLRRS